MRKDILAEQEAFFDDCEAATATTHIPTQVKLLNQALQRLHDYPGFQDREWRLETETIRAMLQGIAPNDMTETMLGVDMIIARERAERCFIKADNAPTVELEMAWLKQAQEFMKLYTKQMTTLASYRKNRPATIDAVLIETDERLPADKQLKIEGTRDVESIVLDASASPEVPHHLQRNEAHKLDVAIEIERGNVRFPHLPEYGLKDSSDDT